MSEHIFISAASADAPLVARLRQHLQQEGMTVWEGTDDTMQQAIPACWALLIVVSPHSIDDPARHAEWKLALRHDKPLLPLVVGEVTLPPLLRRRRPITVSDADGIDMPVLVQRLTWLRSPRGELQTLRDRLADLERSLARGQVSNPTAIHAEIDRIQRQIAERDQTVSAPVPTTTTPPEPVPAAEPPSAPPAAPSRREDWGEAPDVSTFYGRQDELATLAQWIASDRCRLLSILGIGGMGKTTLVTKVAHAHADTFSHLVWRSLRNAPRLDDLLAQWIVFLSNQQQTDLPDRTSERITLLMDYLKRQRCLLVLDNVETILRGEHPAGAYREGYEGYGDLIRRVGEQAHQSVLLLTSREIPDGYERLDGAVARTLPLAGVSRSEGQVILHDKALTGSEADWNTLVARYSGNPLALKLTSEFIREAYGGAIADFLKEGESILGEVRNVLDQQFARLSAFEQELMYWLAIEREPVSTDDLRETLLVPQSRRVVVEAVVNLRRRSLIERSKAGLTLQNVVMEYVT